MSDGIKDWYESMDDYSRLCDKYGEDPKLAPPNCRDKRLIHAGCPHHQRLKKRERKETR